MRFVRHLREIRCTTWAKRHKKNLSPAHLAARHKPEANRNPCEKMCPLPCIGHPNAKEGPQLSAPFGARECDLGSSPAQSAYRPFCPVLRLFLRFARESKLTGKWKIGGVEWASVGKRRTLTRARDQLDLRVQRVGAFSAVAGEGKKLKASWSVKRTNSPVQLFAL